MLIFDLGVFTDKSILNSYHQVSLVHHTPDFLLALVNLDNFAGQ